MNASLTDAIKEAFSVAPAHQVILNTLQIRQEGVQNSIYLVQARRPLIATDEDGVERTFEPCGFQFSLPPSNEEGFQSLNVAIDNVGRRLKEFIDAAKSEPVPVEAIYRPYLSDDLTQPQMVPPLVLYLKDLKVVGSQVTGRATFMDVVNKKFPWQLYTRERFPSLG